MKTFHTTLLLTLLAIVLMACMGNCYGQDSVGGEKVLVVQRIVLKSWQKDSVHCTLDKRDRVSVTKRNKEIIVGKIELISDSTIQIKGKEIKINEIKRISRFRGVETSLIGSSIVGAGSVLIAYNDWKYKKYHEGLETGLGLPVVAAGSLIMLGSGIASVIGVVQIASTKYYKIGEKWKLVVTTKNKK